MFAQQLQIEAQLKEIACLKKKIEEYEAMEKSLKTFFTEDQLRKLRCPKSKFPYSDQTLQDGIQMVSYLGGTGYNFLIKKGFPLPSRRCLQMHLAEINCEPGDVLEDFIKILEKKINI